MQLSRRIFLILALLPSLAFAQNTRWDLPIETTLAQGGNLLPVYAIPGASIKFYSCSGSVCTTLATTYISATSSTTCPTSPTPMQVTLQGSSVCVSTADPYGNEGGWFQPGQYMLSVTYSGTTAPPYYFTVGGGSSGGGNVSGQAAGVVGIATNSTTTGAQSHLNENTSGVDTFTQPVVAPSISTTGPCSLGGTGACIIGTPGTAATPTTGKDILNDVTGVGWEESIGTGALSPICTMLSGCGGSGGTPGGTNGAIQYNNSSSFGGAVINGLIAGNNTAAPALATQSQFNPYLTAPGPIGGGTPTSYNGVTLSTTSGARSYLSGVGSYLPLGASSPAMSYGSYIIGDSTPAGEGPSEPRFYFRNLIAQDTPGPTQSQAISGTYGADIAASVWGTLNLPYNYVLPFISYECCINDAASIGATTPALLNAQITLRAGVRRGELFNFSVAASTGTTTGTWVASSNVGGGYSLPVQSGTATTIPGTGVSSHTNGSTLTITVPASADTGLAWLMDTTSTGGGTFTATLNGTPITSPCTGTTTFPVTCNGTAFSATNQAPAEQEYASNAGGTNTYVVTVTSATSASNVVTILGADYVPTTTALMPYMGLQGVLRQQSDASSTATAAYNTMVNTLYSQEFAAGITHLFFVDVRTGTPGVNTTTDFVNCTGCNGTPGGLHYGDPGALHLAQTTENAAAAAGFPIFFPSINGSIGNRPFFASPFALTSDYSLDGYVNANNVYSLTQLAPGICLGGPGPQILYTQCFGRIATDYDTQHTDSGTTTFASYMTGANGIDCLGGAFALTGTLRTCPFQILAPAAYYSGEFHIGSNGINTSTNHFFGASTIPGLSYDNYTTLSSSGGGTYDTIHLNTASGNLTYSLAACNGVVHNSRILFIKDSSDTNNFILGAGGGDLVNGASTFTYTSPAQYSQFQAECTAGSTSSWSVTQMGGGGSSGFPITIGSTSVAASSTTTTIAGLTLTAPTLTGTTQAANINATSGSVIGWNADTGFSRSLAGTIAFGNGTAGDRTGTLTGGAVGILGGTILDFNVGTLTESSGTFQLTSSGSTTGGSNTGTIKFVGIDSAGGFTDNYLTMNPTNATFSHGVVAPNVTDSALTSGNCVQASTGGLLTTTGSACGSGGSGPTLQTNGVNNTTQSALNFITSTTNATGLTITPSNPATSSEQMEITGNVTNAHLASQTANTVLGALTATTPSGLAVPSCSGATNALIWTSGTGFGCNTITPGTGTVTSVGFTGGLITVATATTTPAFAVAGTSGGIPYFSSTSTWASSALLTNHGLLVGGGAGAAPAALAVGGANFPLIGVASANPAFSTIAYLTSLTSGGIVCGTSTTALGSSVLLTSNVLPKGGGAGACPSNSSITDNGTTVATPETVSIGTSPPACTAGSGGAQCLGEGTVPTNVAASDAYYADSTAHEILAATAGTNNYGILERTEPGSIGTTGATAAVTTATLCAASAGACNVAGQYAVHIYINQSGTACSVVGATAALTPSLTWTDSGGTTRTSAFPLTTSATIGTTPLTIPTLSTSLIPTTGVFSFATSDMTIRTNGTVIQYALAYTGCTTGTFSYDTIISVTRLK